jgi:hypothetical protein
MDRSSGGRIAQLKGKIVAQTPRSSVTGPISAAAAKSAGVQTIAKTEPGCCTP